MRILDKVILASALSVSAAVAQASTMPVDLSGWIENGRPDNAAGNWVVQAGNDAVRQTINGRPTVFFEAGSNAQGTALAGEITVGPVGDDDFVGFVLGYQDGEINSTTADFWLVDWKQGNQSGQTAGLALSHVFGDLTSTGTGTGGEWWQHDDPIFERQRAANLGLTGYNQSQEYSFELIFTQSLIEVKVDGVTELSWTQADNNGVAFTDGAFGFYNFSMANVLYAGVTEEQVNPIPVPLSLPLLATALGAVGLVGARRNKAAARP